MTDDRERRLREIREHMLTTSDWDDGRPWTELPLEDAKWLLAEIERLEREIAGCHSNHHPHNQKPFTPGQYQQARNAIPWMEGDELPEDAIRRIRGT